jgi:hypothetical protein
MNFRIMRAESTKLPAKTEHGTGVENFSAWVSLADPVLGIWITDEQFITVATPRFYTEGLSAVVDASAAAGIPILLRTDNLNSFPRVYISGKTLHLVFAYDKRRINRPGSFYLEAMQRAMTAAIPGAVFRGNDIVIEGKKLAGCIVLPRAVVVKVNIEMDYDLYDNSIKKEHLVGKTGEGKTAREYTTDLASLSVDADKMLDLFYPTFKTLAAFDGFYEEPATDDEKARLESMRDDGFPPVEPEDNFMVFFPNERKVNADVPVVG